MLCSFKAVTRLEFCWCQVVLYFNVLLCNKLAVSVGVTYG